MRMTHLMILSAASALASPLLCSMTDESEPAGGGTSDATAGIENVQGTDTGAVANPDAPGATDTDSEVVESDDEGDGSDEDAGDDDNSAA